MTKSDLKTGMKVVLRNGDSYIVMLDCSVYGGYNLICLGGGYLTTGYYDSELKQSTPIADCDLDIVKVFSCGNWISYLFSNINDVKWKLIWEGNVTPVVKELTMQEVEDKFGCKCKIIN